MTARRPAWAEIDLGAIRDNVAAIRVMLAPGCAYLAVVKANAYGHGDVIAARAALEGGATWLGVILVEEARRLRAAGIDAPILLLHEPPADAAPDVLALDLTPTVFTRGGIETLGAAAEAAGRALRVHLKVDTGLNRLGVPAALLDDAVAALSKEPRLEVEGVYSHFAMAEGSHPFTLEQLARFADACERLAGMGVSPALRHIGNSATALGHPEAHLDMVRVGIATYGIAPVPSLAAAAPLRPALSLKARVAMAKPVAAGEGVSYGRTYRVERPSTIATVPLGYADGWPRHAAGRTHVLIGGRRYPAVGTVCMDSFMVDLGDDACDVGDEIVLIGAQDGGRITAEEVAAALGTIPYEVVTGIRSRVERVAVG